MQLTISIPNEFILLIIIVLLIKLYPQVSPTQTKDATTKIPTKLVKTSSKSIKKNIIVVGAGLIGPRHAYHVFNNPKTELFAIIDLVPCDDLTSKYQTKYFPNISTLISYCDDHKLRYPDGAIICTPNHTHAMIAKELSNYGINLLIEKPVTPSPAESKALKLYINNKVKVLVGHHRRFHPFIIDAKRHIDKLGKIIAIQGSWCLKKHDSYYNDWRKSKAGGPLLINLVHDIDLLQYLLGPVSSVYADLLLKLRNHDDEGCVVILKFKNGAMGTFIVSDNVSSPFNFENSTGENPLVPFSPVQGLYRIFGAHKTLSLPDMKLYSGNWHDELSVEQLKLKSDVPFHKQLDHFVDVINGDLVNCSIDDGISAVLVVQAILKSLDERGEVPVKDLTMIEPDFKSLGI